MMQEASACTSGQMSDLGPAFHRNSPAKHISNQTNAQYHAESFFPLTKTISRVVVEIRFHLLLRVKTTVTVIVKRSDESIDVFSRESVLVKKLLEGVSAILRQKCSDTTFLVNHDAKNTPNCLSSQIIFQTWACPRKPVYT